MAAWNFPTFRTAQYNTVATYPDVFYTNQNDIANFSDNGDITIIAAIMLPIGFCVSGHGQNTSGSLSSYPSIVSLSRYSEADNNYCLRGYHNTASTWGIQFYQYNGNTAGYQGTITCPTATIRAAGFQTEGQMLQLAISVQASTGKRLMYINGVEVWNDTVTPWATTTGMHRSNNARMAVNGYAQNASTTWSNGSAGKDMIYGPMLIDDSFTDLSSASVRANIWDSNGDFVWAGTNGSNWLGGTTPWYFSNIGVPYVDTHGTNTIGTWNRANSINRWGHAAGCKNDWPNEPSPYWSGAKDLAGIKGVWDFSRYITDHQVVLGNEYSTTGENLVKISSTYNPLPYWPSAEGDVGQAGAMFNSVAQNFGWYDANARMDSIPLSASQVWMTAVWDFTEYPTGTMPFRKYLGWRSSNSTSIFGYYGSYPSGNDRIFTLQYYGSDGVARYYGTPTIPNNTGLYALTWKFDNGVMTRIVDQAIASQDYSGTFTTLRNSSGRFGILDSTSSNSGSAPIACKFVAIGSGAVPTNTEIQNFHTTLLDTHY